MYISSDPQLLLVFQAYLHPSLPMPLSPAFAVPFPIGSWAQAHLVKGNKEEFLKYHI